MTRRQMKRMVLRNKLRQLHELEKAFERRNDELASALEKRNDDLAGARRIINEQRIEIGKLRKRPSIEELAKEIREIRDLLKGD